MIHKFSPRLRIFLLALLAIFALTTFAAEKSTNSNQDDFLDIDDAFKVELIEKLNHNPVKIIKFSIAKDHYLYKKRISISVTSPGGFANLNFPQPEIKKDANFGTVEVYHQMLMLPFEIVTPKNLTQSIEIQVNYQGCSEKGLCYPPATKFFFIKPIFSSYESSNSDTFPVKENIINDDDNLDSATLLQSGNFWLIILGFFGFGLLLSLTPCVFPMIPILSGIIVGQENTSKTHIFELSLAYTLGMSSSYTLAGILAALTGNLISNMLQNPWVLGSFSFIFVLLAFSMFGFYEVQLPASMSTNLTKYSNRLKAGKFIGVFTMGALSALIVSPCVAAPLAGALIFISKTHDIFLGGSALFALSMGMGVPLLIIGASAGMLLPKAGNWMNAVKNIFGFLMLGLSIWIISPLLNHQIKMYLYAILIIISSVYLGAFNQIQAVSSGWIKFQKGIALVLLLTGVLFFLNAFNFSQNPVIGQLEIKPNVKNIDEINFKKIATESELIAELNRSKGKYVMLDFYADWCAACKEYESTTFKNTKIANMLKQFNLMQIDVTANSKEDKKLLKKFSLFGPPGIVFFDKDNHQIFKIIGYQDPEKFYSSINKILTKEIGN